MLRSRTPLNSSSYVVYSELCHKSRTATQIIPDKEVASNIIFTTWRNQNWCNSVFLRTQKKQKKWPTLAQKIFSVSNKQKNSRIRVHDPVVYWKPCGIQRWPSQANMYYVDKPVLLTMRGSTLSQVGWVKYWIHAMPMECRLTCPIACTLFKCRP